MFGRHSEPPDPETIERKVESLRPGAEPEPLDPTEVTQVIDLAVSRLQEAQEATTGALDAVLEKLHGAHRASKIPD